MPFSEDPNKILSKKPVGIILSGGPSSVYDDNSPQISNQLFRLDIPILGICYGMQLLIKVYGGEVGSSKNREYGNAILNHDGLSKLFYNVNNLTKVWMSHGDYLKKKPEGFTVDAITKDNVPAAISSKDKRKYGIQFHPEVTHSKEGDKIIKNFVFKICNAKSIWTAKSFIQNQIKTIKDTVGDSKVICGVSGGVDSTVTVKLLYEAIGDNVIPVFIDNGLLRKDEFEFVKLMFKDRMNMPIKSFNRSKHFLDKLKGITNPERKRKIIGREFIKIFDEISKKYDKLEFLAQGTLYPDIIESVSVNGPSAKIKSHHNVGGLPKKLNLKLIEPMKKLFKDEVREIGRSLNVPEDILMRHPFPGPGLAVRILEDITKQKLKLLKEADSIFIEELHLQGLYDTTWQAFVVLLPVKSVGVMGDKRTYQRAVALRAVSSRDGMTAEWTEFPHEFLKRVSTRIVNEVYGINRVVYDITNKPPGTIEWE